MEKGNHLVAYKDRMSDVEIVPGSRMGLTLDSQAFKRVPGGSTRSEAASSVRLQAYSFVPMYDAHSRLCSSAPDVIR